MLQHASYVFGANIKPYLAKMHVMKAQAVKTGKQVQSALGFFGVGFALAGLASKVTGFANQMADASRKLGVSAEFLQVWNYAATQNGIRTEAATLGMQRFSRRLAEAAQGTGELLPVLKQYGIQVRDSEGRMRSTTDVLSEYADVVMNAESSQEQLRLAFKAFDSEGAGLVTVLKNGSAGLDEWTRKAIKADVVVREKNIRSINELSSKLVELGTIALAKASNGIGWFIGKLETASKFMGALSVTKSIDAASDVVIAMEREEDAINKVIERQQALNAERSNAIALAENQAKAVEKLAGAQKELKDAKEDRSRSKLDELANMDIGAEVSKQTDLNRRRLARFFALRKEAFRASQQAQQFSRRTTDNNVNPNNRQQAPNRAAQQLQRRAAALTEAANEIQKMLPNIFRNGREFQPDVQMGADGRIGLVFREIANRGVGPDGDPGNISLQELREQQRKAQEVQRLETEAERLGSIGQFEQSQELFNRADEIRKSIELLKSTERNPWAKMEKDIEAAATELKKIRKQVGAMGQSINRLME